MSNLWFNFRIGYFHIQAGDRQWWRFSIRANDYHKGNKETPFIDLCELRFPGSWLGGKPTCNPNA